MTSRSSAGRAPDDDPSTSAAIVVDDAMSPTELAHEEIVLRNPGDVEAWRAYLDAMAREANEEQEQEQASQRRRASRKRRRDGADASYDGRMRDTDEDEDEDEDDDDDDGAAVAYGDRVVDLGDVQLLDLKTSTWLRCESSYPPLRGGVNALFRVGRKIYISGGMHSDPGARMPTWTGELAELPALLPAVRAHG